MISGTLLVQDPDAAVVEAAIAGIGSRGDVGRLDWLLGQLDHPHLRVHARGALAQLARDDAAVIEDLEAFFLSDGKSRTVPARKFPGSWNWSRPSEAWKSS